MDKKPMLCMECGAEVELQNEFGGEFSDIQKHFIKYMLPKIVDNGIVCNVCMAEEEFRNPDIGSLN